VIFVDDMEPRGVVAEFALKGVPVKMKKLVVDIEGQQIGYDYSNDADMFRAERKVVWRDDGYSDFYDSLVDGRLLKQLTASGIYGGHKALILEGDIGKLMASRHSKAGWIRSTVEDASMIHGWHVYHTKDLEDTVKLVMRLDKKVGNTPVIVPAGKMMSRDPRLNMLQTIPLIGEKKALKVFHSVDCLADLATSTREELQSAYGEGTGGWIHDVFHVPTTQYLKRKS